MPRSEGTKGETSPQLQGTSPTVGRSGPDAGRNGDSQGTAAGVGGWVAGKGHTLQAAVCGNVLIKGFLDTVVNLLPTIPH